jgi:signal transduction histidine kinase
MLEQQGGSTADEERRAGRGHVAATRDDARKNGHGAGVATADLVIEALQPVLDRLPEAILVTDPKGSLRLTNSAADRLFADDPVRDGGDLLSRFEGTGAIGHRVVRGEPSRRLTVRPRHQPNTWYALERVPFEGIAERGATGDDLVGSVWVIRDVTNSADLHAEREAFLAVLSHELRTPLTTIYAGSSVLARRGRLSPPATRTLAMDISAEAARLYDLVENLLVIARLERRILEPLDEPVDLGQVLDAAIRTTTDRVPGAEIVREGEHRPPPVHGDTTYVEQACRNLLLAGLRVSGDGSRLVVGIEVDRDRGEVGVRVVDRGPALTDAELGQAFDLPADAAAGAGGRIEAMGMGPFVVRHVIDAMHGRTWARNRDDGSVEMGFALPVDDRA